jgi:flagellar hook-basal body complex protein FliE
MSAAINAFSRAVGAYQRAAQGIAGGEEADQGRAAAGGSFASMVKGALSDAVASSRQSEAESVKALGGAADLSQVITAVAEAEVALQSVVAIRDKVVEAYKDIMRMPI